MSYNAVPTVSTGDVWTASNHNLYIRDNFRATPPDVVTAKGELIVGGGAGVLEVLSPAADNSLLAGDLSDHRKTDFIKWCSSSNKSDTTFNETGSGNYHVPTLFDVPEGAAWIYCQIDLNEAASTGYFALYPSYDTTLEMMRVDQYGSTVYSQCHGIMPLDSTGGLYYLATDTAIDAHLFVFAYSL